MTGWPAVPGVVGAVAGYAVYAAIESRRTKPFARLFVQDEAATGIPHLRDLCFKRNSFQVDVPFAVRFVKLHNEDWRTAQVHWEKTVARALNTDTVRPDAGPGLAMLQAMQACRRLTARTSPGTRNLCARGSSGLAELGPTCSHDGGVAIMDDVSRWPWRKSSRSAITDDCVEVAALAGAVAVRDSKCVDGGHLLVAPGAWAAFVARLRAGAFDRGAG